MPPEGSCRHDAGGLPAPPALRHDPHPPPELVRRVVPVPLRLHVVVGQVVVEEAAQTGPLGRAERDPVRPVRLGFVDIDEYILN